MIATPTVDLELFCRRWRVRELSLFGSAVREELTPESDLDILISFEDAAPWSLWDLISMRDELSTMFGRPVDLVEKEGLRNPFRRERILNSRKVIYAGGQG